MRRPRYAAVQAAVLKALTDSSTGVQRLAEARSQSAVLVTSLSCWHLPRSGSGWRNWSQPRRGRGGGVTQPSVPAQVRSRGRGGRRWPDEAEFRRRFAYLFHDAGAA